MVRHFFLDKTNTIIEGSRRNMGLNPVMALGYGKKLMRGLIHFDETEILECIKDKTFAIREKLQFKLKMTNYFSLDNLPYEKEIISQGPVLARRAASFDLILFKIPCKWDGGRGYDYASDFWVSDNRSITEEGSNWFFSQTGISWKENDFADNAIDLSDDRLNWADVRTGKINLIGGVYTQEKLLEEYENYINGRESIIVGSQHFDFGNEDLNIDITNYVQSIIDGEVNQGLCLAFAPTIEALDTNEQYVGFVTDNTNLFFHPYVEAIYDVTIKDNRENFIIGKENDLYLYVWDDNNPTNLDEIPECSIEGIQGTVTQVGKGVYCAHFKPLDIQMEDGCIYYDIWSKIALNGQVEDDYEGEFVAKHKSNKLKIGAGATVQTNVVPSLYGINDDEHITQGDVREVTVDFREKYAMDKSIHVTDCEYRLYVKDGDREIDVIEYTPVEMAFLKNYFLIYTKDLIPNEYHIDIKIVIGREKKFFNDALKFRITDNVTSRYK